MGGAARTRSRSPSGPCSIGIAGHRRHPRPGRLLLQGRDPLAGLQLAERLARCLYVVGLITAVHDRLLHVAADVHDLLRRTRAWPRASVHIHESPGLDDRAADRAGRRQRRSPAGSACPSCGPLREDFRSFRALAGAGLRRSAMRPSARRRASRPASSGSLMALSVGIALVGI